MRQIERLEKERAKATGEIDLLTRRSKQPRIRVPEAGAQRPHGRRGGRAHVGIGERVLLDGVELRDRARRARRTRRPERLGKDDAAPDHARAARAAGRLGAPRTRRHPGVLLAAGDGARHARLGAAVRAARDRPAATRCAEPARPLPLLRLGGAREAGGRALRRRAPPAGARARRRLGRELPRRRRADEPPRPREPRGARSRARGVPRNHPARVARPRAARRGRAADARDRGPAAQLVRRRLGGVRARCARRARPSRRRRPSRSRPKPQASRACRSGRRRRSSSASRQRSRSARARSPIWSAGSRRTGTTSRCWPRTAARATTCRHCCSGGKPLFERAQT